MSRVRRTYQHPLLRTLHDGLLEQAEAEINRKMKVAILVAGGKTHAEISRQLGISRAAVKAIVRDLEQVTLDLALDAA